MTVEPKPKPVIKEGKNEIPNTVRRLSEERLSEIAVKIDYHRDRITELERERNELEDYL